MRLTLAFALCTLAASPAAAQSAIVAVTGVDLLGGWSQSDGTRVAALDIRLAPGWHTYWRVPGEAGIPPRFDWSGSSNLDTVSYEWPRPIVFKTGGLQSFGFADRLVLPLRLRPIDATAPIRLALNLDFGVCDDICVPAEADVGATLALGEPEEGRAVIEAALADRPQTADEAGVSGATCSLAPGNDGYELIAEVTFAAAPATTPVSVLESAQPDVWIGAPRSRIEGRTVIARAPIEGRDTAGPVLERSGLRLTLLDAGRAIDIRGCRPPVAGPLFKASGAAAPVPAALMEPAAPAR